MVLTVMLNNPGEGRTFYIWMNKSGQKKPQRHILLSGLNSWKTLQSYRLPKSDVNILMQIGSVQVMH